MDVCQGAQTPVAVLPRPGPILISPDITVCNVRNRRTHGVLPSRVDPTAAADSDGAPHRRLFDQFGRNLTFCAYFLTC